MPVALGQKPPIRWISTREAGEPRLGTKARDPKFLFCAESAALFPEFDHTITSAPQSTMMSNVCLHANAVIPIRVQIRKIGGTFFL